MHKGTCGQKQKEVYKNVLKDTQDIEKKYAHFILSWMGSNKFRRNIKDIFGQFVTVDTIWQLLQPKDASIVGLNKSGIVIRKDYAVYCF